MGTRCQNVSILHPKSALFDEVHLQEPSNDSLLQISALTDALNDLLDAGASPRRSENHRDEASGAATATRQIGILSTPRDTEPGYLFVAAMFPDGETVTQVLGPSDCTSDDPRMATTLSRTIALLRASRSLAHHGEGPMWSVHSSVADVEESELVELIAAVCPGVCAAEEIQWWTARNRAWSLHRPDRKQHPVVRLFFRYPAKAVAGLPIEEVVNLVAPSWVWCNWVINEISRPTYPVHSMLTDLRECGRNPLERTDAYPSNWDMDRPLDWLEFQLAETFTDGLPYGVANEFRSMSAAHLVMLRRDPLVGVTGIMEIADHLARFC